MGTRTIGLEKENVGPEDEDTDLWVREEKSRTNYQLMLALSIVSGILMAAFQLYRWTLADQVTVFIAVAFQMLIYALFYGILTLSLLYALFTWNNGRRIRSVMPALIGAVVLLIVTFVPLTAYVIDYDYRTNLRERNAAVEFIEANGLFGSEFQPTVLLPSEYRHLSKGGGEVTILGQGDQLEVLFYTYRGVVDNFSGFVYTKDGSFPDQFGRDLIDTKKYSAHWYWVSAT